MKKEDLGNRLRKQQPNIWLIDNFTDKEKDRINNFMKSNKQGILILPHHLDKETINNFYNHIVGNYSEKYEICKIKENSKTQITFAKLKQGEKAYAQVKSM